MTILKRLQINILHHKLKSKLKYQLKTQTNDCDSYQYMSVAVEDGTLEIKAMQLLRTQS